MGRIRLYIAASLDGYIARPDGAVDWLDPFNNEDYGYDTFCGSVETVVLGRHTYDFVADQEEWPYTTKRAIVVTSRPVTALPEGVELWSEDLDALIADLKAERGDSWLVGGGQLLRGALDRRAVDELELFLIPVMLGDGIPLFPPAERGGRFSLVEHHAYDNGVVRLVYTPLEG